MVISILPLKRFQNAGVELPEGLDLRFEEALTENEIVVISETALECPDCPISPLYNTNGSFCLKLEHNGTVYGVLTASVPRRFVLDREEQVLFQQLGNDIAFGLYNIEQEEMRHETLMALSYSEARYRTLFGELPSEALHAKENCPSSV